MRLFKVVYALVSGFRCVPNALLKAVSTDNSFTYICSYRNSRQLHMPAEPHSRAGLCMGRPCSWEWANVQLYGADGTGTEIPIGQIGSHNTSLWNISHHLHISGG